MGESVKGESAESCVSANGKGAQERTLRLVHSVASMEATLSPVSEAESCAGRKARGKLLYAVAYLTISAEHAVAVVVGSLCAGVVPERAAPQLGACAAKSVKASLPPSLKPATVALVPTLSVPARLPEYTTAAVMPP